jgi:hypothetical protein
MSTHIINFPGADIHTTTLTSVSNVSVGENLDVTSNLTVSGNVGVGTTEPTESLDIVGNLNLQKVSNTASIKLNSNVVTEFVRSKKLIKYPRVNMTVAAGESSGYQGYYVTESSNSADTNRHSWKAFEGTTDNSTSDNAWAPDQTTTTYNGTDNTYNGSVNLGTGAVNGEWIKLQLPNKIKLEYMKIWLKDNDSTRIPEDWRLYGSNDDTNWTELFSKTKQPAVNENLYTINATVMYKYLAVVVTKISGQNDYFRIVELEYYGIPEYDPDAHGTDVIMRSVPNVPNTDWLEVYWDGQDYTSMPVTVADKSGNGVIGTPSGGVGFDTEYKAFTFDGVDDYIESTLPSTFVDDQVHTFSLWFKRTSSVDDDVLFSIAPTAGETGNDNKVIQMRLNDNNDDSYSLSYIFWNNDLRYNPALTDGMWYHLCGTYSGNGGTSDNKLLYLNGSLIQATQTFGTPSDLLDIDASSTLRLGSRVNHSSMYYFDGSIANFRLFNRALTGEEIWQLYAYQKEYFNVSPDVVTFKSGRLGIGTLEPKATLDIRGEVLINGYQLTSIYPGFASGGDDVYDIDGYRIHAFTNSGTFTVPGNDIYADVLVVGGGGGGGQDNAGGGGAGGLIFKPMHRFGGRGLSGTPDGFYIITIGSGGAGSPQQNTTAPQGGGDTTITRVRSEWGNDTASSTESFSTAIIFIAKGGGPGQNGGSTRASSLNGGSAGGQDGEVNNNSAGGTATQPTQSGDSGTYGYGNNGGASNSEAGGGGGGAGEAGENGNSVTSGVGGNGGDGLSGVGGYDFAEIYGTRYGEVVGEDVYFAGGGAGANKNNVTTSFASGGKGGGGNAGATPSTNENGLPGTGGGGAGAFWGNYSYNLWGGNGGSGIVMIRYKL